jgi:hypothetical protein
LGLGNLHCMGFGPKEDGKGFTNSLYELDCRSRSLRYIGGSAPERTTFKESDFYEGAYAKAHDVLCREYKDPAEWGD